jgi:hypothetical protein
MPLSRHFYELDEVRSALQICLRVHDEAALFWLWELVVSREEDFATAILESTGFYGLETDDWVTRYSNGSVHDLLSTCQQPTKRAFARRDTAERFVALLNPAEPIGAEAADFWLGLNDACKRKNVIAATWYIKNTPLSQDAVWMALALIDSTVKTRGGPLGAQVATVKRICLGAPSVEAAQKRWDSWDNLIGRRSARQYAIPDGALTSDTTRGALPTKYTNIADIREPMGLLAEGCRFWKMAIQAAGITMTGDAVCFPDDDVLENFYEQYFPDDIPDEWSAEDQQKSHGRGRFTEKKLTVGVA